MHPRYKRGRFFFSRLSDIAYQNREITIDIRHFEKAFSTDEAILLAIIARITDCFPEKSGLAVVPPRNDDLFTLQFSFVLVNCRHWYKLPTNNCQLKTD